MNYRHRVARAKDSEPMDGSIAWSEILAWWLILAIFAIAIGAAFGLAIRGP
jgi:hypothetical protein